MKVNQKITVFQAPWASLVDCGLMLKLHGYDKEPSESVPAQYYMPVYRGEVQLEVPEVQPEERVNTLLEAVFSMFNQSNRPNPMTSRSLSVGDVVELDGKHYIVVPAGFNEVKFEVPVEGDTTLTPPADLKDMADYLKKKYVINGKAAILLDNILGYNNCQGGDEEEQQNFLEYMLSGLGISSEDRDLLVEEYD